METDMKTIVVNTLKIDPNQYDEALAAGDIPEWDSLGHIALLQAVEQAYGITFDIGDAIDIESVGDLIDTVNKYKSQD